ncbi:hypothetical protein C8R46DRAFT_1024334 [Mycena filopes]|nr:hypothetical protein C8R46DRAFT_1024334 [Mycena filopes]
MRQIMHKDLADHAYDASWLTLPRLKLLRQNNALNEPLVTVLDYSSASTNPQLFLKYPRSIRSFYGEQDIPWDEYIRRAARSGGRMELHAMVIREGPLLQGVQARRVLLFPQRSLASSFHAGLVRIWEEAADPDTVTMNEVLFLLAGLGDGDAVKIH